MATDLLPTDKTKSAPFSKGDVSAKDKVSSSPKIDQRGFEIEEGANKKSITRWASKRHYILKNLW
jgi:hypothetical protein